MTRLIVTADIHGSKNSWLSIKKLLEPGDILVIAGDLFDTRYGNYSHSDFQPEFIKQEIKNISQKFYYVYGNCDVPLFFPGYGSTMRFKAFGKKIFLHHGHGSNVIPGDTDIIIQGHTHICSLKKNTQIFMNPGSITHPRNNLYTFGIIDKFQAEILKIKTGNTLCSINL